jgi:hypothetical protein
VLTQQDAVLEFERVIIADVRDHTEDGGGYVFISADNTEYPVTAARMAELLQGRAMDDLACGSFMYQRRTGIMLDVLTSAEHAERELRLAKHDVGRKINARIDVCAHEFAGEWDKCVGCKAASAVVAVRMERTAQTPLDVAKLNVFRLEARLRLAVPDEIEGISECLESARADLARLQP